MHASGIKKSVLIYLRGATEPYVPASDAYFSLSGNVLSRQRKWHGTELTHFKRWLLPRRGCCSCSEHDAGDANSAEGTDGARVALRELYVEFASVMFLFSKVLQGRKYWSRMYCIHNGPLMLCSVTNSAHGETHPTKHSDYCQCEWVMCDVRKRNDFYFISHSKTAALGYSMWCLASSYIYSMCCELGHKGKYTMQQRIKLQFFLRGFDYVHKMPL